METKVVPNLKLAKDTEAKFKTEAIEGKFPFVPHPRLTRGKIDSVSLLLKKKFKRPCRPNITHCNYTEISKWHGAIIADKTWNQSIGNVCNYGIFFAQRPDFLSVDPHPHQCRVIYLALHFFLWPISRIEHFISAFFAHQISITPHHSRLVISRLSTGEEGSISHLQCLKTIQTYEEGMDWPFASSLNWSTKPSL